MFRHSLNRRFEFHKSSQLSSARTITRPGPSGAVPKQKNAGRVALNVRFSDFPRQVNQGKDDANRADNLAECTNRFPIHGKT
jgi:hypothetical protein